MKRWTPEEDAIVRSIWASKKPTRMQMNLLPGRTYYAARHRAHLIKCAPRMPGPRPQMEANVIEMIRKHGPICTAEMAQKLLCSPQEVDQYVRRLYRAKRIHISGYVELHENHLSRCFVAGRGIDASKPTKAERAAFVKASKPKFCADPLMAALFSGVAA